MTAAEALARALWSERERRNPENTPSWGQDRACSLLVQDIAALLARAAAPERCACLTDPDPCCKCGVGLRSHGNPMDDGHAFEQEDCDLCGNTGKAQPSDAVVAEALAVVACRSVEVTLDGMPPLAEPVVARFPPGTARVVGIAGDDLHLRLARALLRVSADLDNEKVRADAAERALRAERAITLGETRATRHGRELLEQLHAEKVRADRAEARLKEMVEERAERDRWEAMLPEDD